MMPLRLCGCNCPQMVCIIQMVCTDLHGVFAKLLQLCFCIVGSMYMLNNAADCFTGLYAAGASNLACIYV